MLWLALTIGLAHAASYTLDDIVAASQRGMSVDTLQTMVHSNAAWSVSHEQAVALLRAGVDAEVVRSLTAGAEPTAETLAAAKAPGPAWQRTAPAPTAKPAVAPDEQPPDEVDLSPDELAFQQIESVPGSADDLYRRARAWFSSAFNDAHEVLDLEDPIGHHLKAKPLTRFSQSFIGGADSTAGVIRYVVSIDTKEGRYRATIGSFEHHATGGKITVDFGLLNTHEDPGADQCTPRMYCSAESWRMRVWAELKDEASLTARSLLASLKVAMAKSTPVGGDDDW
jgi:hypothetical protein